MNFIERLNAILPKITEGSFLQKKGLGNEIPFYVFDYPPEEELRMREHIVFLEERLTRQHSHIRFKHVRLFHLMIEHLKDRGNIGKAYSLECKKGSEALWKALSASVKPERFVRIIAEKHNFSESDLILISGVKMVLSWLHLYGC